MSFKTIGISEELQQYVVAHGPVPDPLITRLVAETRAAVPDFAHFQIAPEQAPFMTLLVKALRVGAAVEVGTFTGLSSIAIARGLVPGGRLTCFDISEKYTSIARRYWAEAGLDDRIELRLGPAVEMIGTLSNEPLLDFAFIDADKSGYPAYWKLLVPRMRPGGVILIDNVLRGGRVVTGGETSDDRAIMAFNDSILADERMESTIIPFADGVTMAVKR